MLSALLPTTNKKKLGKEENLSAVAGMLSSRFRTFDLLLHNPFRTYTNENVRNRRTVAEMTLSGLDSKALKEGA